MIDQVLQLTCCRGRSAAANIATNGDASRRFAQNVRAGMMVAKAVATHQVVARVLCPVFQSVAREKVMLIEYGEDKGEWHGSCNFVGGHVDAGENYIDTTVRHVAKKSGIDKDVVRNGAKLAGVVHVADFFGAQVILFVVSVELDGTIPVSWQHTTNQGVVRFVDVDQISGAKVFDDVVPILEHCLSSRTGPVWTATSSFDSSGALLSMDFVDGAQNVGMADPEKCQTTSSSRKESMLRLASSIEVGAKQQAEGQSNSRGNLWDILRLRVAAATIAARFNTVERGFVALRALCFVFNSPARQRLLLRKADGKDSVFGHTLARQDDVIKSTLHNVSAATTLPESSLAQGAKLAGVVHEAVDLFGARSICFVVVVDLDGGLDATGKHACEDGSVEFAEAASMTADSLGADAHTILQHCLSSKPLDVWTALAKWSSENVLAGFDFA